MKSRASHRLMVMVALIGGLMLTTSVKPVFGAVDGPTPTASSSAMEAQATRVTWAGYGKVTFGMAVVRAQRLLGGTMSLGCGDVLQARNGLMFDSNYAPEFSPHRISSITSGSSDIRFPLGLTSSMTPSAARAAVLASQLPFSSEDLEDYPGIVHTNVIVRGPRGRTLRYAYRHDESSIGRLGVSLNEATARAALLSNGC